jgi:hypothetical protein
MRTECDNEWRGSVVECGGKRQRDAAVVCRTVRFGQRIFFQPSKAVSPLRGFALASLPPHSTTLSRTTTLFL